MFSSCFSYDDKKRVCLWMMEQGLGYKRISNLLGLKLYTVRDYGRRMKLLDPRVEVSEAFQASHLVL